MYLQIPTYCEQNRNLHCIVSPRSHYQQTLTKHIRINNPNPTLNIQRRHESYEYLPIYTKKAQNQTKKLTFNQNYPVVKPFQLMVSTTKHSKSLANNSSFNKFYSFKKIREQRCKEQTSVRKVIKSIKLNSQDEKLQRRRVIQHLDEVTTVQSKNSPRSSLNSLGVPQVQQSIIIMKGADLYDDLLKQNRINKSKIEEDNQQGFFQTPVIKKGLCESTFLNNEQNTPKYQTINCFTDPRKDLIQKDQITNSDRKNIHNFLKHLDRTTIEDNKLSFLKSKKIDRRL